MGRRMTSKLDPFSILLGELNSFLAAENYNGFHAQIAPEIRDKARPYLVDANQAGMPLPELTPDGEGGIEIEWENNGRHLAINFSVDGNGDFLSWREPQGRYEGERASRDRFIERLGWLG